MTDRTVRWAWFGGSYIGAMLTRGLAHRFPSASAITFCATAAWFLLWLARDNLQFKREVAEQRRRLAERKAAVRAAKERSH